MIQPLPRSWPATADLPFDFPAQIGRIGRTRLMKKSLLICCAFAISISPSFAAEPENPPFPGVQKAMTPEQYEAAGLSKLDPAERAKLDEFIKQYVAVSERVATTAVDKA